jgi:predicted amidophosphoribosyltransferase
MPPTTRTTGSTCLHCGANALIQARGLCRPCWDRLDVRGQYPPMKVNRPATSPNKCEGCGCYVQHHVRRCPTCHCPDPQKRALMQAALAEFERRAAAGLPMFETVRESGMVY